MRVLHLINSLALGGAEALLVSTVEELLSTSTGERHLVAALDARGQLVREVRRIGAPLSDLKLRINGPLEAVRELRAVILREQVELVHAHLFESSIAARLATPPGTHLICTYHTGFHNPASIEYSQKRLILDRLTVRRNSRLFFVSQSVRNDIELGLGDAVPGMVLLNSISRRFQPAYRYRPGGSLRLVAVGNLREQKNHLLALQALRRLPGGMVTLDIYGNGPLKAQLQDFIAGNNLSARLVSDVTMTSGVLASYDAFIMTSKHEGMSLALMEAMRTGMPSILNDVPTLRETGRDAAMYFERDSVESLASTLRQVLAHKERLMELSDRAISYSEMFTADSYCRRLRDAYRSVLSRSPSRTSKVGHSVDREPAVGLHR